jgi:hypothetical protein
MERNDDSYPVAMATTDVAGQETHVAFYVGNNT